MRWIVVALAACGSSPPPQPERPTEPQPPYAADLADRCRRKDYKPAGNPTDYAPPVLDGFAIAPPKACPGDTAYIRVERLSGSRRFGTGRGSSGGFSEGCMAAPATATDCPIINMVVPGKEVYDELTRRGYPAGGTGLGPCGDSNGDYAAWNMSITVLSWRQAEEAVRLLAAALDRYDIAGSLGVAVTGVTCAVLL